MQRRLFGWLRMYGFWRNDWWIPDGEPEYRQNASLFNAVMPACPGYLQSDGTWLQWPSVLENSFYQSLKADAQAMGQLYYPHLYGIGANVNAVLADPALRQAAIDGAMALATDRFDAPWDGVLLNLEVVDPVLKAELGAFYQAFSERTRAAGLTFLVSLPCHGFETPVPGSSLYTYDYALLAEVADYMDLQGYTYVRPEPRSIAPLWWLRECIEYALSEGIQESQLIMGLGIFCDYWPVTGEAAHYHITHAQAMELLGGASSSVEWVESNANGLVREKYAAVGRGHIWLHDGDTMRDSLNLITEYSLRSASLFIPGMGDESIWRAITEWKQPEVPTVSKPTDFFTVAPIGADLYSSGGLFGNSEGHWSTR